MEVPGLPSRRGGCQHWQVSAFSPSGLGPAAAPLFGSPWSSAGTSGSAASGWVFPWLLRAVGPYRAGPAVSQRLVLPVQGERCQLGAGWVRLEQVWF